MLLYSPTVRRFGKPAGMAPAAPPVGGGGGGGRALFWIVSDTDASETFPEVSVARAVMVWAPSATAVVLKETDQLCVPLAAAYAPLSTFVSTFATPRLSDAVPTTAPSR